MQNANRASARNSRTGVPPRRRETKQNLNAAETMRAVYPRQAERKPADLGIDAHTRQCWKLACYADTARPVGRIILAEKSSPRQC